MPEELIGDGGEILDGRPSLRPVAIWRDGWIQSASIGALAAALATAQGEIKGAAKDSTNPHFRSSYADLSAVWGACRDALSKNGLSVLQPLSSSGSAELTVTTILLHASGEWISASLTLPAKDATAQALGSCATYGRRYGLASMVGVAPEDSDDDGEAASGRGGQRGQRAPAMPRPLAAAPGNSHEVQVNGRTYKTAGITAATLVKVWDVKAAAKVWMEDHGVGSTLDLTEEMGAALLADVVTGTISE